MQSILLPCLLKLPPLGVLFSAPEFSKKGVLVGRPPQPARRHDVEGEADAFLAPQPNRDRDLGDARRQTPDRRRRDLVWPAAEGPLPLAGQTRLEAETAGIAADAGTDRRRPPPYHTRRLRHGGRLPSDAHIVVAPNPSAIPLHLLPAKRLPFR